QRASANARHGCRSVRFHDLTRDADGVTKIVFTRYHRFDGTLRQRTMTDLAPPRAARSSRFAHAERRKIVVQNEPLRLFATAVSIEHLRFLDRRQRGKRDRLGFAALENGRAVRARQEAHFATDRPYILVTA